MNSEILWRLAYGLIGLTVGLVLFVVLIGAQREAEIVCPPFMDKTLYEINAMYVVYEPGQGPTEYVDADNEFAKACGFESVHTVEPPEPPPPEEGGA